MRSAGTDDAGDWRIERVDEAGIFDGDYAAWEHVLRKALIEQSAYHLTALRFIRDNNSTEFDQIKDRAAQWGLTTDLVRDLQEVAP